MHTRKPRQPTKSQKNQEKTEMAIWKKKNHEHPDCSNAYIWLLNQDQTIDFFLVLPAKTGQTVVSQETSQDKSKLKKRLLPVLGVIKLRRDKDVFRELRKWQKDSAQNLAPFIYLDRPLKIREGHIFEFLRKNPNNYGT